MPSFPQEMNKYIEAKELCSNLVNFAEWANHLRFQCMRDLTYKTKIIFKGAVTGKQIYHIKTHLAQCPTSGRHSKSVSFLNLSQRLLRNRKGFLKSHS